MNPLDLQVCRMLAPAAVDFPSELPESVSAWATTAAGHGPDAIKRRIVILERHARLVAFALEQRALGAAEERLRVEDGLPVAWSAAFTLEREPIPKPRPRTRIVTPKGGKPFAMIYTPTEAAREEALLDKLAAEHAPPAPWAGPVLLVVEARIPLPASWPKWQREAALAGKVGATPRGSGDGDNYAKLLQDALSGSNRWWADDSQVVELRARKTYSATPSWLVEVYLLREVATKVEWEAFQAERGFAARAGATGQLSLIGGGA